MSETGPHLARQPWSETAVARGFLFVGIVWSLAGTFIVLQQGLIRLGTEMMRLGWIDPQLALTRNITVRTDPSCQTRMPPPDTEALNERLARMSATIPRRYVVWQLGYRFGFLEGTIGTGITMPSLLAKLQQQLEVAADALGQSVPTVQRGQRESQRTLEFSDNLAQDRQCIFRDLSQRFGPHEAVLFKLGAVIGYAHVLRIRLPELGAVFGPEIRAYAEQAGLPNAVWSPLIQASLEAFDGSNPQERVSKLVAQIDNYILTRQEVR